MLDTPLTRHDADQRLTAHAAGVDPQTAVDVLKRAAERFEIGWDSIEGGVTLRFGETSRVSLSPSGNGIELALEAADERGLYRMQQITLNILERGGLALEPVWSRQWADRRPPNLIFASLEGVTQISPSFRRVRLVSTGFAQFGAEALHFRFLLPPLGRSPVWPEVDDGGRTVWPRGEDAIHRPVYTFRSIDPEAGVAEVDVFVHEGGRVTRWTHEATPGTPVGLMGPTGRAQPESDWMAFFADETALPAVTRHLATLPATTRGEVFILAGAGDPASPAAPGHVPEGMRVSWLDRAAGGDLVAALQALEIPGDTSRQVWFSASKSECEAARALLNARGLSRAETHVTAYWNPGKGDEG